MKSNLGENVNSNLLFGSRWNMNLTNHNMPTAKYVSIIMIIVNDIDVIFISGIL